MKTFLLGLVALALLAMPAPAADRPNIIFILADDLGYGDLGCYGQKLIKTPHIDRLASEGIRFTQAYAGGPVCVPSRCVLMTGRHNGHTRARDNVPHYSTYLQEGDLTIARMLQQAGYRCGGVGKWSLGDAGSAGRATNQGFDTWLGYLNQDHAHYYYTEYLDDDDGRLELTGNTQTRKQYSHDLMAERALRFIRESKDRPFFLYAAFTLPHRSAAEEDPDRMAVPTSERYRDEAWPTKAKKYAAMIDRLDRDVGRIVALVDELSLRGRTLIVFTSDNGALGGDRFVWEDFASNGPLRGHKAMLTEGGIRVPFIARWPGRIPAGRTSGEIIAFQDMLPTLAEVAGVRRPDRIDGISIVAALEGGRMETPRPYLYWDYGHCRPRYGQAVRLGDWKAIRPDVGSPIELYDLGQDPGETRNVAAARPVIVERIARIMETAATPSERYPIGKVSTTSPTWRRP